MNVIFFTSGEGFGHIARAIPVADELEKRGHTSTLCTYGEAAAKVKKETRFSVIDFPKEIDIVEKDGTVDVIQSILHSMLLIINVPISIAKSYFVIKRIGADAVIVDEYSGGLIAAALSGVPTYSIFNCVHPYGTFAELKGISGFLLKAIRRLEMAAYERFTTVLICDFAPPNTVAKYNVEGFMKKVIYMGPMSKKNPYGLPSERKIKKELGLGKFMLVTRGKYGKESEISEVLESLAKMSVHKVVVMGDTTAEVNNVRMEKFEYTKYYDYLKACDLVITHGGHSTMMECCIFGKPMVLIVTENYGERLRNGKGAEELGIAELIPYSKLTPKILHETVDRMLKMKKNAAKFKTLAKKEVGAQKVASFIESEKVMRDMKKLQS